MLRLRPLQGPALVTDRSNCIRITQPLPFSPPAFSLSLQEKQHFQEETDLDKLIFNIHKASEETVTLSLSFTLRGHKTKASIHRQQINPDTLSRPLRKLKSFLNPSKLWHLEFDCSRTLRRINSCNFAGSSDSTQLQRTPFLPVEIIKFIFKSPSSHQIIWKQIHCRKF